MFQSPVFLLFLDCVWQLIQQFPTVFEFTETYLTTLWDSTHLGLFENFLFNTEFVRHKIMAEQQPRLMCVWDWSKQFSSEDIALFRNPLYVAQEEMNASNEKHNGVSSKSLSKDNESERLFADVSVANIQLWKQCYFRWIPPANIVGGGTPSSYLQQCILVGEILHLQHQIDDLSGRVPRRKQSNELFFSCTQKDANTSNSLNDSFTSAFPFNPNISMNVSSFFNHKSALSTPISTFVKHSSLANIELLDDDIHGSLEDLHL